MQEGIVIRAAGGFFYVFSEGEIRSCSLRGKVKNGPDLLVGDRVLFSPEEKVVEKLLPRRNCLYRPAIANVDLLLAVIAAGYPALNRKLLDRLLVSAEHNDLEVVIVINKTELDAEGIVDSVKKIYVPIGYRVETVSALQGRGLETLTDLMAGKTAVLSGQSGVGKSTLLNALNSELSLRIGSLSEKLKGGKHTTREVGLFPLPEGALVADTPGFNRLTMQGIGSARLKLLFPEFRERAEGCYFKNCRHINEPGCAVKAALDAGEIDLLRYEGYLDMLKEFEESERKY